MTDLPSGTVTFLFTDIEGSTALWERDRQAMAAAVERHIHLLGAAIAAQSGVHFKTVGDAVQAAFSTAPAAVAVALEIQRTVLAADWGEIGPLRVRIALHAGDAEPDEHGDYLTAPLNRLARLLAIGHGGQILLSQTVQQLTRGALPCEAELRDLGEHRLRDLLKPERVFQLLHPDLPADFPALKSLDARPNNLPLQPTAFVGRTREVGEVAALLRRPDVRLLTLTGPGGTGKTRLALQVAAELLDDFPDGVYFVQLALLSNPENVLSTIAATLGIREEGGQPLLERLRDVLTAKQLLVVLDNVEHLIEAAPLVAELLSGASGLKVLVTSRMPLHLRAEREYPVPPLGLPPRYPPLPPEQLSQYETVRLFIERAQAIKPDFVVDVDNAAAVTEICYRLDGLPLAIELAATRVRMLSPQAMLARLEQRLPFLIGGARDAPQRQRTLRDTIAWSADLLSPNDQTVFRRLAVFDGGATIDVAERVTNPTGDLDVFGGLERLVEHSLVRQASGRDGEPRLTMLGTIREFGRERLAASGEEGRMRVAHAAAFRVLGEDCQRDYAGRAVQWLAQLVAEADNVRAALAWVDQTNDRETGLALAVALGYLAMHRGGLAEPQHWLSRFLAGDALPSPLRAHATVYEGVVTLFLGASADALAMAKAGEEVARAAGSDLDVGLARLIQAMALQNLEEWDEAVARYTDVVAFCEHLIAAQGAAAAVIVAEALNGLGSIAEMHDGDRDAAGRHYEAALQTMEAGGVVRTHRGVYLQNLAGIERERGHLARAATLLAEALPLVWEANDFRLVAGGLEEVAWCAIAAGQHREAARLLGAFRALFTRMAFTDEPLLVAPREHFLRTAQKALGPTAFAEAWAAGQNLSIESAMSEALALTNELVHCSANDYRLD